MAEEVIEAAPPAPPHRALLGVAALLVVLFVAVLNTVPLASNDLWIQMKIGQLTVDSGRIPRTVLFPFTPARDAVFNAHEWLPSILFHVLDRAIGIDRLLLVQGAAGLAQFGLSWLLARRLCASAPTALLLAASAMLVANYRYVLRPELFALALLTSLLLVLNGYRDSGRASALLWTVPIAILWANCHGSFVLGPVVAGTFALGEGLQALADHNDARWPQRLRRGIRAGLPYALCALAMTLSSMVNPRGPELLRFAFQVQASDAMHTQIKEWLPTFDPRVVGEPPFRIFVAAVGASLALAVAQWRRLTVADTLLFALFTGLAMQRNRHIVWFGFIALAFCARLIGRRAPRREIEQGLSVLAAGLGLAGLCGCLLFGNTRGATIFESPSNNFSAAMARELEDPSLTGNVYNSYELGGELIYRDWPRLKPSIDSRVDSYGDDYFYAHQQLLVNQPALLQFLSTYGVTHMLLLRRDFDNAVKRMPAVQAQWHIRLADSKMVLLERNPPAAPATPSTAR